MYTVVSPTMSMRYNINQICPSRVVLQEKIGYGNFGIVHKAVIENNNLPMDGRIVAVKLIAKDRSYQVKLELHALQILHGSPNIVNTEGWYETTDHIGIVMELLHGGDLRWLVKKVRRGYLLSEAQLKSIAYDSLVGLQGVHAKNLLYGDMKPNNLMLRHLPCLQSLPSSLDSLDGHRSNETRPYPPVNLVDFGCVRTLYRSFANMRSLQKPVGTPIYCCPQKFKGDYDEATDLWSLGITLMELVSGVHPLFDFNTKNKNYNNLSVRFVKDRLCSITHAEMAAVIRHSDNWNTMSPEANDFILRLLDPCAKSRMTSTDALKHPWLSSYSSTPTPS